MYLKKFIYINWGNVPNAEFEFGDINLFSGGNGSGKTTAADAIQTLMTAAHDGAFHFNPGQDESTQRGRGGKQVRTLAPYGLGCDDGAYARLEGSDGYLAGVFHPTPGESAEVFTAVIAMRAFIDQAGKHKVAKLDDQLFFIVRDCELQQSDFLKQDNGGAYVQPMDKVFTSLRQQYSAGNVEKYDRKKAYLARLYGALRGKRDAVSEREAMHAAKAFSRFMAYKPVDSIDGFVANEVLEGKELGPAIREISGTLKTIHNMEKDARQLQTSIALLQTAKYKADFYIDNWLQQQVLGFCVAQSQFLKAQTYYINSKQEQQRLRELLNHNEREREIAKQRAEELRSKAIELEAQRQGVSVLRDKDQLEQEVDRFKTDFTSLAKRLLLADEQVRANARACKTILQTLQQVSLALVLPALADKKNIQQLKHLSEEPSLADLKNLFMQDWVDISPLEAHLDQALVLQQQHKILFTLWQDNDDKGLSLRDKLLQEVQRREETQASLKKRCDSLEKDIRSLDAKQVSYPRYVVQALEAIRQQYPQADARVLCDHVEIMDEQWQTAIEGYIGGARFGILVEADYEAEAIRLVRALPGREAKARVIQGEKARQDLNKRGDSEAKNAITRVMSFSHATAEAYIRASYGSVLQVDNAEQLKQTRRGLSKDCLASGNYAMFRCDIADENLVFGQGAREKAVLAKRELLSNTHFQYQQANDQFNELQKLQKAVGSLGRINYADLLSEMLVLQRKLYNAEQSLENLDLSEFENLEQQQTVLKGQELDLTQQMKVLEDTWAETKASLKVTDVRCDKQSSEQEELQDQAESCEDNLRSLTRLWPDFDPDKALDQAEQNIKQGSTEHFSNEQQALNAELQSCFHQLQKIILEHNHSANSQDAIAFDPAFDDPKANFQLACDSRKQLDSLHNRLKNNVLATKHQELGSLRSSFNNSFVTHLCHTIFQAIQDGERTLNNLNEELQHHRFGADRERFYFGWEWVPEFKEYWQFFKAVMENPSLGEGESLFDTALDEKHCVVRDRLMVMLLDEDEQKAQRELNRLADYRNYRRYEIYKEPEGKEAIALSKYGTGSGGQLETPAYIIRSAAITSAFRFGEGNSHLRMVLVDEAFSKMDEHRSKEVINYLTQSLGLQLLFIMPSSKSGPFTDLISHKYVFTKCPTEEFVAGSELKTTVLVDRQILKKDAVKQLWAERRREVSHQASLDFMEEFQE